MSDSAPESYGLDEMDVVRDLLDGNIFRAPRPDLFDSLFGLTPEQRVKESYQGFKEHKGKAEDPLTQYFMSAGLVAKEEPEYRRDKLFDFLYDALSDFEPGTTREELESVYNNLEK